jgi:CRISPR-associated protein Cas1
VKQHLNTLFITTQGSYISKDGQALTISVEHEHKARIPIITLGSVVCFGRVSASPPAMALCAESGVAMTFLSEHGRFLANVSGFTPGNVLLRREQYRRADRSDGGLDIAHKIVAAKLANTRTVLLRAVRDHPTIDGAPVLNSVASRLATNVPRALQSTSLDQVRGIEGESAALYFGAFNHLITTRGEGFVFRGRSRRPPMDAVNALLSFVYMLLVNDARAACEASGLDAAVGYLHRDRPGRPGLALDLIEEFRAPLADRLVLSLINRQQVTADGFITLEAGGVIMDDATRKVVLVAYQERKQEILMHPFLGEKTTTGLLLHLQARLLARYLRGDLDAYPAFIWK